MTTPSPLVVENLSFRYRDRPGAAIHDISFETKPGEILLIAGAKNFSDLHDRDTFSLAGKKSKIWILFISEIASPLYGRCV